MNANGPVSIDDCIARGKDVGQGGPLYNSVGFVGVGLANAADSLLAIQQAVFEEKRVSMDELTLILKSNFEGHERLRQFLLNRVPKWGNNNARADAMAVNVARRFCEHVHTFRNGRGGRVRASLFTLDHQWNLGRNTGAMPDGRPARASLAPGAGPTSGLDKNGVTALVNSVSKIDFSQTPNGAVLDITFHPSAVSGDDGLQAFVSIIKTFFNRGGYALQFNVFDTKMLRDAQKHPEKYASLQIRVTGWSVYFTALSPFEQEQFIIRTTHGA
jgi:formate C-acetyltransferase